MSLRQKQKSPRMINIDSNTSLTVRPMPSEMNNKNIAFPGSPQSAHQNADIGFKAIIKDQSVTKLLGDPVISDMHLSMDKMPTIAQALAGVPISPSNNTMNTLQNLQTQASSVAVKSSLGGKLQTGSNKKPVRSPSPN